MDTPSEEVQKETPLQKLHTEIRKRRAQAHRDALEDARALKMNEEETKAFLSSADSNTIWDAQQGHRYKRATPPKKEPELPKYTEMGFLSDEKFKALFGYTRETISK